jgi:UDP-glucose 4-epimerase
VAEPGGRRVVVTGVTGPLGRRVAELLAARDDVEVVIGLDDPDTDCPSPAGIHTERLDWNFRALTQLLGDHRLDTVVQVALTDSRSGAARTPKRANVIETMHLAAAAGARGGPVRTLVAASSTEVYPSSSHSSLLHPEGEPLHPVPDSFAATIAEAERYVRELAIDNPHIAVSVLRTADLAGGGTTSPLAVLLGLPLVPVVAGFDPQVQFLHGDDAARALVHACLLRLAGTYNVAGEGSIGWVGAARLARRRLALVPPFATGRLEPVLARLQVPHGPAAMLDVLRYGRCAATEAIRSTGFTAEHSTRDCVRLLAAKR